MKNLLSDFEDLYVGDEEIRRQIENFDRIQNTPEWKFFKKMLMTIRGVMATEMLSKRHTELDPVEKDVAQRTFYNIGQMLTFFGNPVGWIKYKKGKYVAPWMQGIKPKKPTRK